MRPFGFIGIFYRFSLAAVLIGAWVATASAGGFRLPSRHVDEGENLRVCSTCHESDADDTFPYRIFDHTASFVERHGRRAAQNEAVCGLCHPQRFCSDCHGVRNELKPSQKYHANPRRRLPHRGDYLTRHRIDGRIDPVSCFRCHRSPKTQRSCRPCHG